VVLGKKKMENRVPNLQRKRIATKKGGVRRGETTKATGEIHYSKDPEREREGGAIILVGSASQPKELFIVTNESQEKGKAENSNTKRGNIKNLEAQTIVSSDGRETNSFYNQGHRASAPLIARGGGRKNQLKGRLRQRVRGGGSIKRRVRCEPHKKNCK